MRDMLEKIDEKLDRLQYDLTEVKIDTAKNTLSLDHHIKRTDELQDIYENLEGKVSGKIDDLEKDSIRVKMIWKVVLGIATLTGIVATVIRLMQGLKGQQNVDPKVNRY